jgi:hypothetical protein
MPHRDQEFRDSCGLCEATATTTCARCGLPLCVQHTPSADARCTDCEGDLYVHNAKMGRVRTAMMSLGVAGSSAVGTIAAFALGGWATTVIAGTMGVALTAFTTLQSGRDSRSKRRRKKFLAERKPKYEAAVGAAAAAQPDDDPGVR